MSELLPCALCGANMERRGDHNGEAAWNWFEHADRDDSSCLLKDHTISSPDYINPNKDEAAAWNTRPTPPSADVAEIMRSHTAVVDALRFVFKDIPDDAEMLSRMEALGAAERAFTDALARHAGAGDVADSLDILHRYRRGEIKSAEDALAMLSAPPARGEGWDEAVRLDDCPPGLFMFGDCLGFKSEYSTVVRLEDGSMFNQRDAYVVESGEYFWGGTSSPVMRGCLMVRPAALPDDGKGG